MKINIEKHKHNNSLKLFFLICGLPQTSSLFSASIVVDDSFQHTGLLAALSGQLDNL